MFKNQASCGFLQNVSCSPILINGCPLYHVEVQKYLCIIFEYKLIRGAQLINVCRKISCHLCMLGVHHRSSTL